MQISLKPLFLSLLVTLSLAVPLQAAPRHYAFQDLGALEGGNQSWPYGVNQSGQVVGVANDSFGFSHAFLKTPGQPMQDLGYDNEGYGINDSGQVVGMAHFSYDYLYYQRAFLKNPGDDMQDLGCIGGIVNNSRANGINNAGQVVGKSAYYDDWGYCGERAFLKNPDQPMESLGTLGGWISEARAINELGQVAGTSQLADSFNTRAFLKNPGEDMQDLGSMGQLNSEGFGLNNLGQVVGYAYDSYNNYRAFLKNPGEDMQYLGALDSFAYGINDAGQVVGTTAGGAFLWEKGVMYNLNHLVVNLPAGTTLWYATAINNRGCIAGFADDYRAFLLTPVGNIAGVLPLILD